MISRKRQWPVPVQFYFFPPSQPLTMPRTANDDDNDGSKVQNSTKKTKIKVIRGKRKREKDSIEVNVFPAKRTKQEVP